MPDDEPIVDAEVVPDDPGPEQPPLPDEPPAAGPEAMLADTLHREAQPASTELVRRTLTNEVIRPLDADAVVGAMNEHQELLRRILDRSDWQGTPDANGSFVKKSGWRKVALAYNLTLEMVPGSERIERAEDGTPLRATVTWRATAPNGRTMEASGHCADSESRFAKDKGRQKLENDLRATAETRAKNRAISDLIGMGKVSAEEAVSTGQLADEETIKRMPRALGFLFTHHGDDRDANAARAVYDSLVQVEGGLSQQAAEAVIALATSVHNHRKDPADAAQDAAADGDGDKKPASKPKPKAKPKES